MFRTIHLACGEPCRGMTVGALAGASPSSSFVCYAVLTRRTHIWTTREGGFHIREKGMAVAQVFSDIRWR